MCIRDRIRRNLHDFVLMRSTEVDVVIKNGAVLLRILQEAGNLRTCLLYTSYEPVGEPVDMKQAIIPEVKAQCEALGKAMAEKLLAE